MIAILLAGTGAGTYYVLLCAVRPVHRCPRCKAGGTVEHRRNGKVVCPKCKGKLRVERFGARTIHRMIWENIGPWIRLRLRDLAERRREAVR